MDTPIPDALLQDLCNFAKARFIEQTGCAGKLTIDPAFPEPPSSQFTVIVTVIEKATGERRCYDIEVRAATVR